MEEVLQLFKKKESIISELNEFCELEYDHESEDNKSFIKETVKNDFYIQIASTDWVENEDFTVEVYFDVSHLVLKKYLHGNNGLSYVEPTWYENIESAIESIKDYEFDSLTVFEKGTGWLIAKLS